MSLWSVAGAGQRGGKARNLAKSIAIDKGEVESEKQNLTTLHCTLKMILELATLW